MEAESRAVIKSELSFRKTEEHNVESVLSSVKTFRDSDSEDDEYSTREMLISRRRTNARGEPSRRFSMQKLFDGHPKTPKEVLLSGISETKRHSLPLNPIFVYKLGLSIQNPLRAASLSPIFLEVGICNQYPTAVDDQTVIEWRALYKSDRFYLAEKLSFETQIDERDFESSPSGVIALKIEVKKVKEKKGIMMKLSEVVFYNELKEKGLVELAFTQINRFKKKTVKLLIKIRPTLISVFRSTAMS